jgi:D-alanine-D-alanine ligase
MKKNVLLLFGGPSEEHEVSLRSAAAVFQNLNQDQNEILLCGVTREKEWYLQPCPDPQHFPEKLSIDDFSTPVHLVPGGGLMVQENNLAVDCVFLLLHGTDSEDGPSPDFSRMAVARKSRSFPQRDLAEEEARSLAELSEHR